MHSNFTQDSVTRKHKIVSNNPNGVLDFCSGTKRKPVMSEKKVIASRTLKDWTTFTTQNNQKQKRKLSFFITILCFPDC
jgi:hypothetical protein